MLSRYFYVNIDRGISAPGHGREVVDVRNSVGKRFLFQLKPTVQLPGAKGYGTWVLIYTVTHTYDIGLSREF